VDFLLCFGFARGLLRRELELFFSRPSDGTWGAIRRFILLVWGDLFRRWSGGSHRGLSLP
jgi:hypothetical protein